MEKNEFIEKCQKMIGALAGLGEPCHVSHDRDATWFSFQNLRTGEQRVVYNGSMGVVWCHFADLSVRMKESNDFLKVI